MADWSKRGPSVFYETEWLKESAPKGNNALLLFLLILRTKKKRPLCHYYTVYSDFIHDVVLHTTISNDIHQQLCKYIMM